MSDVEITRGTPGTPGFPANTGSAIAAAAYPPGTPVYISADSTVTECSDASAAAAQVTGLLPRASVSGDYGPVQYGGLLTLTEAQWNAVISDATPAGLAEGKPYYVSTAGKITKVSPSAGGTTSQALGIAWSSTTMLILLSALPGVTH